MLLFLPLGVLIDFKSSAIWSGGFGVNRLIKIVNIKAITQEGNA